MITQRTIRVVRTRPGYFRSVREFKRAARKRSRLARVLRRVYIAVAAILALSVALGIIGTVVTPPVHQKVQTSKTSA